MPEVRLIDANALKAKLKIGTNTATYSDYCNGYCDARQVDLDAIDSAPTIEAEPVIHCKDCVFWESKRVSCEGLARCKTGESGCRYRFSHDFCSRAQRRDAELIGGDTSVLDQ